MRSLALLSLLCVAIGCSTRTDTANAPHPDGSAVIVRGSEFSGSVLDALRYRVPGTTIGQTSSGCPTIMFRGARSLRNQRNPSVYVDGTLMLDTCILQQINSSEVERFEVYASGMVSKANIQRDPFGVIMVYRIKQ